MTHQADGPSRRILLVAGMVAGGAGRHVHELATGLVQRGHQVMVACPEAADEQFGFGATGALVQRVAIHARPHPPRDLAAVRALGRLARGAEVVHAHGVRAGALAALSPRGTTPLVTTLHNAAPQGGTTAAVFHLLEGVVARRADLVLGVSEDLLERMVSLGARNIGVAVVPAPRPRLLAPGTRQRMRDELGIPDGSLMALVVARLSEQKALPVLLDALRHTHDLDLSVMVAGDGPLRASLQSRIEHEGLPVRLLGRREDVPALMAAADLAVSSAAWEGQPVWLQEALQAHLPIVATDVGGTSAVVGDAARLVPAGDSRALAVAVREVAGDPAVRGHLRLRARRRAGQLPTADDAVDAALAAYERIVTGPPRMT